MLPSPSSSNAEHGRSNMRAIFLLPSYSVLALRCVPLYCNVVCRQNVSRLLSPQSNASLVLVFLRCGQSISQSFPAEERGSNTMYQEKYE